MAELFVNKSYVAALKAQCVGLLKLRALTLLLISFAEFLPVLHSFNAFLQRKMHCRDHFSTLSGFVLRPIV